jgi:predicted HTH transcriptional regulator
MLQVIDDSLNTTLDVKSHILNTEDRLAYFSQLNQTEFTRKDYMNIFKEISSATASRDLKKGVEIRLFKKQGDKTKTIYGIFKKP